ncbi:hypothetical protein HAX54_015140, partial [Datura stramonium]|nr:hypothetical protein [Datura stramonium]
KEHKGEYDEIHENRRSTKGNLGKTPINHGNSLGLTNNYYQRPYVFGDSLAHHRNVLDFVGELMKSFGGSRIETSTGTSPIIEESN